MRVCLVRYCVSSIVISHLKVRNIALSFLESSCAVHILHIDWWVCGALSLCDTWHILHTIFIFRVDFRLWLNKLHG